MMELKISTIEDRMTVAAILIKNGYTVSPVKRKKTKTSASYEQVLEVYFRDKKEGE